LREKRVQATIIAAFVLVLVFPCPCCVAITLSQTLHLQ
jgi:hypothetical protein